jgi:hypothetical protein
MHRSLSMVLRVIAMSISLLVLATFGRTPRHELRSPYATTFTKALVTDAHACSQSKCGYRRGEAICIRTFMLVDCFLNSPTSCSSASCVGN